MPVVVESVEVIEAIPEVAESEPEHGHGSSNAATLKLASTILSIPIILNIPALLF